MRQTLLVTISSIVIVNQVSAQEWEAVGDSINSFLQALQVHNNKLYVAGSFTKVGTTDAYGLAEWDGTSYTAFNPNLFQGDGFEALTVHQNNLICAGDFTYGAGNPAYVATWDGSSIADTTYSLSSIVHDVFSHNDTLYVGGHFTSLHGIFYNRIAKHNGVSYDTMGKGFNSRVHAIAFYDGEVIAGGEFTMSDTVAVKRIARWTGSGWDTLGNGFDGPVYALAVFKNKLYAAGSFTKADDSTARYIASWDGTKWSHVGGSISGGFTGARALHATSSALYVGGNFSNTGAVSNVGNLAMWDGNTWHALGDGIPGFTVNVSDFAIYQGRLHACKYGGTGLNYLYRYSVPVGEDNVTEYLNEVKLFPNPSSGTVQVETMSVGRIALTVTDLCGRLILQRELTETHHTLDLGFLDAGIYLVTIRGEQESVTQSLMIH